MANISNSFRTLGANLGQAERQEHDFYATHPDAVRKLLEVEEFNSNVWEPCAGQGHIGKVLEEYGYNVKATDLIDRGYGQGGISLLDCKEKFDGDIVTNPPYKDAQRFVEKMLDLVEDKSKIACLLKIQFLESQSRQKLFKEHPPKVCICILKKNKLCEEWKI